MRDNDNEKDYGHGTIPSGGVGFGVQGLGCRVYARYLFGDYSFLLTIISHY